jgi:hypothetical protein
VGGWRRVDNELTLKDHYEVWAMAEASKLKNRTLKDLKRKFRPVRLENVKGGQRMIIRDADTGEEFHVSITEEQIAHE